MPITLINHNEARPYLILTAGAAQEEGAPLVADQLLLSPGTNQVDADLWAAVKKHPEVQARLDDGRLSEGKAKAAPKAAGKVAAPVINTPGQVTEDPPVS